MSGRRRRSDVPGEVPARQDVETLTAALGTTVDPELLVLALTHRSFAHEAGGIPPTSGWSSSGTRCWASS